MEYNWIALIDELPEQNESVWLIVNVPQTENWQLSATYIGDGRFVPHGRVKDFMKIYTPTHWMPLPAPPKQEG